MLEPKVNVIGAALDGRALLLAAESLPPDVIITYIAMPQMNSIRAAKEVIQKCPSSKIILLTVHSDSALIESGAC